MRLIGIIIIGLCIALYGFYSTYKIVSRMKQLNDIVLLIETIKQKIRFKMMTVSDIITSFKLNKEFDFLFNLELDNLSDYFTKICFENDLLSLDKSQKQLLYDFFTELGKSDLQGQINHCESFKEIFKKEIKISEKDNLKRIKLYPSLSILSGLLVILILF